MLDIPIDTYLLIYKQNYTYTTSSLSFILFVLLIIVICLFLFRMNTETKLRKRRAVKKRYYPTISILLVLIIITSIFSYAMNFEKIETHKITNGEKPLLLSKPSIVFLSLDGQLWTNENLKNRTVVLEFVIAETEHAFTMTKQLINIKNKIDNNKTIFLTIDIGQMYSKNSFNNKYKNELGIDWEIGFDINNYNRNECNVSKLLFSIVILKRDTSIGKVYTDFENIEQIITSIDAYNQE